MIGFLKKKQKTLVKVQLLSAASMLMPKSQSECGAEDDPVGTTTNGSSQRLCRRSSFPPSAVKQLKSPVFLHSWCVFHTCLHLSYLFNANERNYDHIRVPYLSTGLLLGRLMTD